MNNFLLCFIVMLCHFICSAQTSVILSGKILNPRKELKVYVRYYKDYITFDEATADSAEVDKTGKFSMNFSWKHPAPARLEYGLKGTELYIAPGDQLNLHFDAFEFENSLQFSGKGSEINNYLVQKAAHFSNVKNSRFDQPEELFSQLSDSIHEAKLVFLKDFFSKNNTDRSSSNSFMTYEEAQLNYDWAENKLNYPGLHAYFKQLKKPLELPAHYYDFMNLISLINPAALQSIAYVQFLDVYVNDQVQKILKKDSTQNSYKLKSDFINQHFKGEIKDYLIANKIYLQLTHSSDLEYAKQLMDNYRPIALSKDYMDILDQAYAFASRLSRGKPAPEFTCQDVNGKFVSLSDFKGKIVYLEFWASWCEPCRMEMPHLIKLEEEMKDQNIVFLHVSMDENKIKWKNYLRDMKMKSNQLIANGGLESQAAKLYNVKGIPKFVIIARDATIIDASAKRPSDAELKIELKSLLEHN